MSSEKNQAKKSGWKEAIVVYLHDAVYLMISVLLIFLLIFRIIVVSGGSMKMTLLNGDYLLLLNNVFYSEPKQGDVVVLSKHSYDNGAPIVKRVIATEGQRVNIDFEEGIVYVDGIALDEPYASTSTTKNRGMEFPLTVEENCIFVLGDNRKVSRDSRDPVIGLVDEREVLGKALFLFFPGPDEDTEERDFDRIGAIE